ncbi:hypothetical protein ONZ45_g17366 [Pleurotus djamor]|nr:hypothetical protein ONZ45_g17366 [Pleurotus djamor]
MTSTTLITPPWGWTSKPQTSMTTNHTAESRLTKAEPLIWEIASSTIDILATVGSRVPGLSEVAKVTLRIIDKAKATRENRQSLVALGKAAFALIEEVGDKIKEELDTHSLEEMSDSFANDYSRLASSLLSVTQEIEILLDRTRWKRMLYSTIDKGTIARLGKEIDGASTAFTNRNTVAIRAALEAVSKNGLKVSAEPAPSHTNTIHYNVNIIQNAFAFLRPPNPLRYNFNRQ